MERRAYFPNRVLPYLLVAPQLVVVLVFFYWPAVQAVVQSVLRQDPFGLHTAFVGLDNFRTVLTDPFYLNALRVTAVFSAAVILLAMSSGLLLAATADKQIRGAGLYKTLLIWPYAVAPAVAAALWLFIFHPTIGMLGRALIRRGLPWDFTLNGTHAMVLVILAGAWKQVSYNFLFFLAGLQSIPRSLVEAAAVDGAGSRQRFWKIIFPLLSPTTFFLLVVNLIYAFFDTFGVIHSLTRGGPGKATETLIYKVYTDGVINLDLGGSSAQSVILLLVVITLTALQFRYLERKVYY
ncbi:MAG: sn-glycerol-3-phosphate ABC transporter permease UgpA [Armatimonadota bacterium]|nr:sn-glycerol-3-phosphate ABC transporter permease UgpA [Armatimonadota bacterium]MDR7452253.1 sn-glycerol-3-phosphate ABC transporter permease UgpA [Armatimonadota bacterium]MDR7466652.1 sn-glycerol-3-phosphate ABC transporter permease UgpA [Armatimonadota bacterium]MDR7492874.1 sn-glycerol-3-phosphate ABC transporter permease UgpA [Armatimonadota bacterium]MDR7498650.1 sn-glycerol-3-phosphate ABC transporter permease UgpA [Armatimonadota bacterium]